LTFLHFSDNMKQPDKNDSNHDKLTIWSRVLLEKLVKKFPAFHGSQRFITVFKLRPCITFDKLFLW